MELAYEIFSWGWDLIWMPIAHFVLSGLVAMFIYWAALKTFSLLSSQRALLLAIACGIIVHVIEDYTLNVF